MTLIGQKIAALRQAQGFSQDELGRRASVTQAALSRIETGIYRQPKRETLRKVSRVLGVSIGFLCGPAPVVRESDPGLLALVRIYERASLKKRKALLSFAKGFGPERRNSV